MLPHDDTGHCYCLCHPSQLVVLHITASLGSCAVQMYAAHGSNASATSTDIKQQKSVPQLRGVRVWSSIHMKLITQPVSIWPGQWQAYQLAMQQTPHFSDSDYTADSWAVHNIAACCISMNCHQLAGFEQINVACMFTQHVDLESWHTHHCLDTKTPAPPVFSLLADGLASSS